MEIRLAHKGEETQIRALWEYSFDDSADYINYFFEHYYQAQNAVIALNNHNRIVFCAHLTQHYVTIGNKSLPVSYVVGVVTRPEARGKGIMRQAMAFIFDTLEHRQQNLSIMMAIDSRLYKPYGYEFISDMSYYEIDTNLLKRPKCNLTMRPVTILDCAALSELYQKIHREHHIVVERSKAYYQRLLLEYQADHANFYLVEDAEGTALGYLVYTINAHTFAISEWGYLNVEALNALLNFIYHHNLQLPHTTLITTPNDPIKQVLPYWKRMPVVKNTVKPFMLARINNVARLFSDSNIPVRNQFKPFNVKVIDENLSVNNQTFQFSANQNTLLVEESTMIPSLSFSINTLTQLFFGYLNVQQAILLGLIQGDDDYALNLLTEIFTTKTNYLNEYN